MSNANHDVIVTVGDRNRNVVDAMLSAIAFGMGAQFGIVATATLLGSGQWGDQAEHSGALLFLGLDDHQLAELRHAARNVGAWHGQEAVGLFAVPAGSALVWTDGRTVEAEAA